MGSTVFTDGEMKRSPQNKLKRAIREAGYIMTPQPQSESREFMWKSKEE